MQVDWPPPPADARLRTYPDHAGAHGINALEAIRNAVEAGPPPRQVPAPAQPA
ncbi:hypothetical protein K1W54_32375 [Micromonospora sp. CPCC 205371]|nr:hypothetical protein [Micromonospora sp. CPCC 205371]